jgi:hypothetical protein
MLSRLRGRDWGRVCRRDAVCKACLRVGVEESKSEDKDEMRGDDYPVSSGVAVRDALVGYVSGIQPSTVQAFWHLALRARLVYRRAFGPRFCGGVRGLRGVRGLLEQAG